MTAIKANCQIQRITTKRIDEITRKQILDAVSKMTLKCFNLNYWMSFQPII